MTLKFLFHRRRWLLWIPVLAGAVTQIAGIADFLTTLIGGLFLWIPFWFAWRLSDGFATLYVGVVVDHGTYVDIGLDPATAEPCTILITTSGPAYCGPTFAHDRFYYPPTTASKG